MIDRPGDHAVDAPDAAGASDVHDEVDALADHAAGTHGGAPAFPPPPPRPGDDASGSPSATTASEWRTVPRAGMLTPAWRWTVALAWIGVFVGLSAVWKTSRELGLPTWWLGPLADPRPIVIMLLPFVAPTLVVLIVFNRVTWAPWAAIGGGVVTAAIAIGDLNDYTRLGIVELALAAAGTAVGIASFSGRYRRAKRDSADERADVTGA